MKKYFILFTLMLLVFNYSYSVSVSKIMPENDWKVKKLKGKVKTMVSKIDEYDYSGKVENKIEIVTNFNESGYITEEVNYYNGDKKQIYSNKYNKDGLLIESNDYIGRKWFHTYEYDKNGNLVQIKRPKNSAYGGLERTTYNKAGKIIRTQTYTQNQYDKAGVKITDDSNYLKDKNGELYQSLTDYSYIYNKDGKLQEIRDNVFSSGTIKYSYEYEDGLYVETAELVTQKFVTYYDKDDNEVYYMWVTWRTSQEEPRIQLYLVFKDTKRDKYGNLTYQVANRVEVVDITKGEGNDIGIYEKKVIEYEYYE